MPDDKSELDASIKESLSELEGEGNTIENDPRPAKPAEPAKPKEDPAPDPNPKPQAPKQEPKPDPNPKPKPADGKKEPSMMPRYQHAIAEKNWEKEKTQLTQDYEGKLAKLQEQINGGAGKTEITQTTDDIKKLADELGLDPDKIEKLAAHLRAGMKLPKEVDDLIKMAPRINELQQEQESQQAEDAFSAEFDKDVMPLIEEEYGTVSGEQLRSIKAALREKIVSDPKLLQTPLNIIYQGTKEFRGIVKEDKKTLEPGGKGGGNRQGTVDFENLTEEQYAALSDEDQDRYADYQRGKTKR